MPKITLLGAGSGFTQPLFTDILNVDGLDEGVIGLVDIDGQRLNINVLLLRRILELMGKKKWKIEASTDRKKVLPGTDYLISTIEVSGVKCVRWDNDIPLKYGIDQCIGDTIGPGGIMKALRTLPPFLGILEDARKLCPQALILNYTNPMSMMTLGAVRATQQPFVGLCHSVQGNSRQIAQILDVPYDELEWQCGGINHLAWFTVLKWKGRCLHAALRAATARPEVQDEFPVRCDLIRNLGYFATESCGHFSEYVPYYRKRKDILKRYCGDGYLGGTSFYADHWPKWRKATDQRRHEMAEGKRPISLARGHEYASDIIEAHQFDRKKVIYASVFNHGLIPNLPQTGVVEVATLVDKRGFMPTYFGNLPEQCAALCRSNMAVFDLCVDGILNNNREAVIHSMMLDPLSAAVCSLDELRSMAEELFAAEKDYIPKWCQKPKGVAFVEPPRRNTAFVRALKVTKVLPRKPLEALLRPPTAASVGLKMRDFRGSFLHLHEEITKAGAGTVFYSCRFKCPTRMPLNVLLGYDGPLKVWLDGTEVFHDPRGTNPAKRDAAKVPVQAAKGAHELVIALDTNSGNAWGIFLRFERTDITDKLIRAGRQLPLPEVDGAEAAFDGVAAVSSMSARNETRGKKKR
jgi:alpha-galactosidase